MKNRTAILVIAVLATGALVRALASDAKDLFFTTNLPEPDRAELFIVPGSITGTNPEAHLNAEEARKLASLIRTQSIGEFGMRCDNPRYGIRFYEGGKLIASETICFGCHWINPVSSDIHPVSASQGFDVTTPQAKQLADYLKEHIPLVLK